MHFGYAHRDQLFQISGLLALVLSYLSLASPQARPDDGVTQPDALYFGTVRQGAIVEGSLRLLIPGNTTEGIDHRVVPPAFVKVRDVKVGTQEFGTLTKIYCDVELRLDTSRTGVSAGLLRIDLGDRHVSVRITSTVSARESGQTRVLMIETPFQKYSTSDSRVFDAWKEIVEAAKLDTSYLEPNRNQPVLRDIDLKDFDVVFLSGTGIVFATDEDFTNLKKFISSGGRVVVVASRFMGGSVEKANKLIENYGLQMRDEEARADRQFLIEAKDILSNDITVGVAALKMHRPTPINVTNTDIANILVNAGNEGDGYVCIGRGGAGDVIALGVPLWWSWISRENAANSDNARLLQNLLKRRRD